MSASLIQGVQSKGVGTSLKHFAVNNQESRRFTVNAVVDERTMHEIYLAAFERAVRKAKPWTVMCAYNRVNGDYCSQHEYLLTTVLRDQWGFEGFVVSDWGAVHDRVSSLRAGLELQMPGPVPSSVQEIVDAVKDGSLEESVLNQAVERLLKVILRAKQTPKGGGRVIDIDAHHRLAARIASEGIVLLKNQDNLLPLTGDESIAVIGQAATIPVFQGGGSSHITVTRTDIPLEIIRHQAEVSYATGDGNEVKSVNAALIQESVTLAQSADVALLFIALPAQIESEGYDRVDLSLTPQQIALIKAVAAVQPKTVVVLNNGSAVEMKTWIDSVPAVIEAWLPGQAGASAVLDVIFGAVNPSGRLAETFPLTLEDTPSFLNFPGENAEVRYGEGIYIGYRGYDAYKRDVLFPFGYGLSYTQFSYANLGLSRTAFTLDDTLTLTVDITNTGKRAGQEVVQVYVHDVTSRLARPPKELKAFAKVALEPGETKTVTLSLDDRAFSYYDPAYHRWLAEAGEFEILVGSSAADIHLRQMVMLTAGTPLPIHLDLDSTLGDWLDDKRTAPMVMPLFEAMIGGQENADAQKALGTDMLTFFRDLPLTTVMNFQAAALGMSAQKFVEGMIEQVHSQQPIS